MKRIAVWLGVAVVFLAAGPAMAATDLVCQVIAAAGEPDQFDGPMTISLDEATNSVSVHWPGYQPKCFQGACPPHRDAWSAGPLAASFGSDEIRFSAPDSYNSPQNYILNRLTGQADVSYAQPGMFVRRLQCAAAKRQF